MPARRVSFTAPELRKKYPALAEQFEALLETRKAGTDLYNMYISYSGRWLKNGRERRLDLGNIIETLENHGHKIDFIISKK